MDLGKDLLESWRIASRLNLFLLEKLSDAQLDAKADKSKSVRGHFAHIHNVRLMWLKAAAPELMNGLDKLDDTAKAKEVKSALEKSGKAIEKLVQNALDSGKSVKGFKPTATAFVCYLCSHEAFHRSQIELVLRQTGSPLDDKTAYGLWEWGVR
ncbi:MAG: DinB family protein [Fimbriimonadaceae bacterium]